ncbi:TRAP transporter small permease [Microvirga massiliensis]|uniref:TRAP transporter small permease n=1 Tax=Microvirga massiliensis TaxID=1033741 RepID=UPI0009E5264A|nr:TRAP transporter small permease [Microvirga massiliensis]
MLAPVIVSLDHARRRAVPSLADMPSDQGTTSAPWERSIEALVRLLALAGGLLVVGLGLLVTTSVLMRWILDEGINGEFELVQMGLAIAVFAFLPLCQAKRGNVMVDTFTTRLPRGAQIALDMVWDIVFAGFAAFIAWRLTLGAMEAHVNATTSMVLGLPIYYAIWLCAGMAAFLAVVCLATAWSRMRDMS